MTEEVAKRKKEFWNYDIKLNDNTCLENIHAPVELFCAKKHKGYYVRGQISECPFPSRSFPGYRQENRYRIIVLALASDFYKCEQPYLDGSGKRRVGIIHGKTKEDFFKIKEEFCSQLSDNKKKQNITKVDLRIPIELTADDFKSFDFSNTDEDISGGKAIILVELRMICTGGRFKRPSRLKGRLYPFSASYFSKVDYNNRTDVHNWLSTLYDSISFCFDHRGIRKQDFFVVLEEVGGVSHRFLAEGISNDFIDSFNSCYDMLSSVKNPLVNFCFSFLQDLRDDLVERKLLAVCSFCGDHFAYKKGKKYCSIITERKDCGKKARNKRFYISHQKELRKKSQRTMKELRDYYKSKGVKK